MNLHERRRAQTHLAQLLTELGFEQRDLLADQCARLAGEIGEQRGNRPSEPTASPFVPRSWTQVRAKRIWLVAAADIAWLSPTRIVPSRTCIVADGSSQGPASLLTE